MAPWAHASETACATRPFDLDVPHASLCARGCVVVHETTEQHRIARGRGARLRGRAPGDRGRAVLEADRGGRREAGGGRRVEPDRPGAGTLRHPQHDRPRPARPLLHGVGGLGRTRRVAVSIVRMLASPVSPVRSTRRSSARSRASSRLTAAGYGFCRHSVVSSIWSAKGGSASTQWSMDHTVARYQYPVRHTRYCLPRPVPSLNGNI